MNIQLDGEFEVRETAAAVFEFLTSPAKIAPLLPYFRELRDVSGDEFRVVLEIGVPQIRGSAEAHAQLMESVPGTLAKYRVKTRMALGVVESDLAFSLVGTANGTVVRWETSSKIRGNIAAIAGGVLSPLAKRNVAMVIASLQQALGPVEDAAARPVSQNDSRAESAAVSKGPSQGMWSRFVRWLRAMRGGR